VAADASVSVPVETAAILVPWLSDSAVPAPASLLDSTPAWAGAVTVFVVATSSADRWSSLEAAPGCDVAMVRGIKSSCGAVSDLAGAMAAVATAGVNAVVATIGTAMAFVAATAGMMVREAADVTGVSVVPGTVIAGRTEEGTDFSPATAGTASPARTVATQPQVSARFRIGISPLSKSRWTPPRKIHARAARMQSTLRTDRKRRSAAGRRDKVANRLRSRCRQAVGRRQRCSGRLERQYCR
jgi:hypothetical protein